MAGAGFLAVMGWHVHFARVGFPLEAWPLVVVLGIAALAEAARANSGRWWGIAGAAAAAGIYVYNGQVSLLGVFAGAICVWLVKRRGGGKGPLWGKPSRTGVFAGCAAIVVLPDSLVCGTAGKFVLPPLSSGRDNLGRRLERTGWRRGAGGVPGSIGMSGRG